jgi:hypothetical protein
MKQREHVSLDSFAVLKKSSPREAAAVPRQRAKLPERANEATCVFTFFEIAAKGRISEKSRAFRLISIISGSGHDV